MARCGTRHIILAHLSRENNTPQRAWDTVQRRLNTVEAEVLLEVAPRSEVSPPTGRRCWYAASDGSVRRQAEGEILSGGGGGYVKRLQRFCKLELVELPESRLPESPSPAEVQRALAAEAVAIRERLPKGGAVIALCIEGKPCPSVELSRRMEELAVAGKTQLTFLIGGSVGLDESLKRQADWRLSMSPMTFPHHLARIMLLEQIYRAYQISAGTKYHK